MKKHCHRNVIEPRAPMIALGAVLRDLALAERVSVQSFADGWATTEQFDNLCDARNILALAAEDRQDEAAKIAAELGLHALLAIKERHKSTGKLGVTGEELKALKVLADVSEDFWRRQSGSVFARHYNALRRSQLEMKSKQQP